MIEVKEVQKKIKGKNVLDGISFVIKAGEIVALIGPNGAGKTTLMSCMIGDRFIDRGKILIDGKEPRFKDNKKKIGVLMQENVIPKDLKVLELIKFFQEIYTDSLTTDEVIKILCFTDKQLNQLAGKLSGGQKRLLAFVLCLVGKPEILFLDEPTAGMDTSTRQKFWEIIEELKHKGTTIVYSSHYIEEVEHTADRILVLTEGFLVSDTTPYAIRNKEIKKEITLPIRFLKGLEEMDHAYNIVVARDYIRFETDDIDNVWEKLQLIGCGIKDIELQNKTLLNTIFEKTREA